jgi:hypothetical protein
MLLLLLLLVASNEWQYCTIQTMAAVAVQLVLAVAV